MCSLFLILHADSTKLEPVTLQLQWKHQFEFAGFYAAKEMGFYEDIGLDVEFLEFKENTSIVDEVLSSNADYGLSYSSIIADYLNGKPIIMLANFFKQSPLVLIVQEDIKTLYDLKNKKVMGLANNIHNITLYTMLSKFGITGDNIKTTPPSFSIKEFRNKEVDAMSAFITNEPHELNEAGVKYNIFDPLAYGSKYYDANLFTSEEELKNHPQRVRKFRDASIKGWHYALKHKKQVIELIKRKYNSQNRSRKALAFEAQQIEHIMLTNVYDIGSIDINRLETIADTFKDSGFIQQKTYRDLKNFVYDLPSNGLKFNRHELAFLKERQAVIMCIDPNWMPFESIVNSKYVGINADFIKKIETRLGIPFKIFNTQTWSDSIEAIKQKKCDILSLAMPTGERERYLHFSTPYIESPLVIVAKTDKHNVLDITLLENKKIAVVKDYTLIDIIKNRYPNLHIIEVNSVEEGLKKVANSDVYGFAGSSVAIEYYFQQGDYEALKTIAHFDEKLSLGLAVQRDNNMLFYILQKVVLTLTNEEKESILKKWLNIKYEKTLDYTLIFQLMMVMLFIVTIGTIRHFTMKKLNKKLTKQMQAELKHSQDKDKIIFDQNKLAAMGEMIENIAHQWRQPLSQINSSVLVLDGLLQQKNIQDSEIEEKLQEIESLTLYLSSTIDDFKNFFSPTKKREVFKLSDILLKTVAIIQPTLKHNNILLQLPYDDNITSMGYPNELQQAILVIINNAKDVFLSNATTDAKITITTKQEQKYFTIFICDNAGGINKDIIDKIFDSRFSTKRSSESMGIGLYISKMIIETSMKGSLSVYNNKEGACFTIRLPYDITKSI